MLFIGNIRLSRNSRFGDTVLTNKFELIASNVHNRGQFKLLIIFCIGWDVMIHCENDRVLFY